MELLTKNQIEQIEKDYSLAQSRTNHYISIPNDCTEMETILLKFLYAYMPISDIASYDVSVFLKSIRSTLKIREQIKWGSEITGEYFLNYVLSYRLNNEDLVDYRETFFNELFGRIKGMSMKEAVLEVNYWCFEKATYQSTNIRTISPFGIIKNAYGRCGEESAFMVAALRSICIPARQCYTPKWAHCDDNHAWVEVFVDGKWQFIGACEPEPVLNKGWFTSPAQRAMLVHARIFSNIVSEQDITSQSPVLTQLNILDNYTKTKTIKVKVSNPEPIENADVFFQLINFSELFSIASLKTDKNGELTFKTGYGDLIVHVSKDGYFMHEKILAEQTELSLDWNKAITHETKNYDIDFHVPAEKPVKEAEITQEMLDTNKKRLSQAATIRKSYEATFIQGEKAKAFAENFEDYKDKIAELISLSNGNHAEIEKFLKSDCANLKHRVMILCSLDKKDLSDISSEILEEHLTCSLQYEGKYEKEIYQSYVLCPRVYYEMISPYRQFIINYFDKETVKEFIENPYKVYTYINNHIKDCDDLDYATLISSAEGLLKVKIGSEISKKVLFVCICRSFGIPSRLNISDMKLEYWLNGKWITIDNGAEVNRSCKLTLTKAYNVKFEYAKNFSIAKLVDGKYVNLKLGKVIFEDKAEYLLEHGYYRIMTANRMVNGDILANIQFVKLEENKAETLELTLREIDQSEQGTVLPEIMLKDSIALSSILNEGKQLIAFLEEGLEPTEHLLDEMLEHQNEFRNLKDKITFILSSEKSLLNQTLAKAHGNIQMNLAFVKDSMHNTVEGLYNAGSILSRQLPLVMIIEKGKCTFSTSGYNVGTGSMILKILNE